MIRLYRILVLFSLGGALAAIKLSLSLQGTELTNLVALPAGYVVFAAVLARLTWTSGPSIFLAICLPTAFMRYVAFPALCAVNGGYRGRSLVPPSDSSFEVAITLMCYELLVVGLLIAVLERKHHRSRAKGERAMRALPLSYVWVVAGAALIFALSLPRSLQLVNVFTPTSIADDADLPAVASLAAMTLMAAKVLLFLGLLSRLAGSPHRHRWRVWVAALLCAGNITVFFGTNRMAMVLTAVASIWIFRELFGRRVTTPIVVVAVFSSIVFSLITDERDYYQRYDSGLENLADNIQSYTGGVYNVAIGVEIPERYPRATDLSVLAYDFLRPTVGFNVIVQRWEIDYSNVYYNDRMFMRGDTQSQIMPMIAQGNLFFPRALAPMLSLFFVFVGYKLLELISRVPYIEIRYGLAIVVLRFGFFWGQNSMNMMNFASLNLIIPLFLLAGFFVLRALGRRRRGIQRSSSSARPAGTTSASGG